MWRKSYLAIVLTILTSFYLSVSGQIVADHHVVSFYDDIPQQYIDSVKKMLVDMPGESHSGAYRHGQELLELLDTTYQVETFDLSSPPAYSDQFLRIGRHDMVGESSFFSRYEVEAMKAYITSQNSTGTVYDVMGFGWCWDMTWVNLPGGLEDPVYRVHWAGSSTAGPDGNKRWGLDSGDSALTGNRVNMDTYLSVIGEYNQYCKDSLYPTRWIFTTGPVDSYAGTEGGFQREIKQEYIRNYVLGDTTRVLFDYADILCWSDSGDQNIVDWDDEGEIRPHTQIHPDNLMDYDEVFNMINGYDADEDHIGEVGALRIAKAMWWMLARMSGWDGNIPVTGIQVASEGDTTQVMTGGVLQFTATVMPEDAANPAVSWKVINGTGTATISSGGLLRAGSPGLVGVVAFALDGSDVADTMDLTILPPLVPVTGITVTTAGDVIEMDAGTHLQCSAAVLPLNATNPTVLWRVVNLTGSGLISSNGLVLGVTEGSVDVIATAEDGSQVADTVHLTIKGSVVLVNDIEITSPGNVSTLVVGEELKLTAAVLPLDASNPAVAWSVVNGTGSASISTDGLVTALSAGTVEAVAAATDGSGVSNTFSLAIEMAIVLVSDVEISSEGDVTEMKGGETLQLTVSVLPLDATNPTVLWSVVNVTGTAAVSTNGLVTAMTSGRVDVVVIASDGSMVSDTFSITINSSAILVSEISISSAGDVEEVDIGSTLQFTASVLPANATNQNVTWSLNNGTGLATMCDCGTLTALAEGTVEVVATAQDGSGAADTFALSINGPSGLSGGNTGGIIVIYPNPTRGMFFLDAGDRTIRKIEVVSAGGAMVLESVPEPGQRVIAIDLSDQQPGAFFIHTFTEGASSVLPLIMAR